jgi:hypothetical protein
MALAEAPASTERSAVSASVISASNGGVSGGGSAPATSALRILAPLPG